MADTLKFLATEIALSTTPNTVNGASLVRVVNTNASISETITVAWANGTTKGTMTLGHYATDFARELIVKLPTDTLASSAAAVKAVSVAHSY